MKQEVAPDELVDESIDRLGRVYTRAEKPPSPNVVPIPTPAPDAQGRRPVGVRSRRTNRARVPDAQRKARVLLAHARAVGLAGICAADLHQEPRAPRSISNPGR
jgi:hypothetical protein